MNITFLIGNGFDVNLGLKTKYTDFYNTYIKSNEKRDDDDPVKKFCYLIENNYETWSDFEMAFASNAFGTKEDVRDILYDFSSKFVKHLKAQEELCNYSNEDMLDEFRWFLTNGYTYLEGRDKQILEKRYSDRKENTVINFVNFNYTNTLDQIIQKYISDTGSNNLVQYKYSGPTFYEILGSVLHIHGSLGGQIILGIDSSEQLADENLKNNDLIDRYCVKYNINVDIGNQQIENDFINLINNSDIIYAYGISFGASDESRWRFIYRWLKTSPNHKLIVYKHSTDIKKYDRSYLRKLLDCIEGYKNEYLSLLGFNETEYEKYYNQIFVIDSADVLDFKLIQDDSVTDEDNEEEVLAAST
ncbi:MAG: hypothetical protein J1E40_02460 [Oscillospiraceae bacterium]|nr:hypothetical protein [Oscillospiraceae bacterium]